MSHPTPTFLALLEQTPEWKAWRTTHEFCLRTSWGYRWLYAKYRCAVLYGKTEYGGFWAEGSRMKHDLNEMRAVQKEAGK